ncbi:sodium-coupled monocarboxylate transporter 1-like [Schistocerca gregaria]|uniref:sodium-coupled monocarboxylate transporter 1-like n=1 Tax=Schistocerca gregaria TaxID=7010 RepID=UPI00211EB278|nr:sodium-coupled monocarboxylate transporter 1-like [Schistocerca gregaria]
MLLNGTAAGLDVGPLRFDWLDHAVFLLMLVVSGAVGVYYGFFRRQQTTSKADYLHGGKRMGVLPIAISQIASHTSGLTLVGVPSEVYLYGSLLGWSWISALLTALTIHYIYLPVFFGLQVTSAYEYLERRYNKTLRVIASGIYAFNMVLHIPFFIYVPALVFNQVSGISVHVISPIVCAVCIFYTMLGGLKAVVWTDVLQSVVALGACLGVMGLGLYTAGGPLNVWRIADQGGRVDLFEMTLNPFVRTSFWTVTLGVTANWMAGRAINQDMVQRFIALPDLAAAKRSLMGFTIGIIITNIMSISTGLLVYSLYYDCDPLMSKAIQRPDQLLPHYVMQVASHVPMLPGLYVAGVFSAALSSMSSAMNALAGTIYEDFVQPRLSEKTTERTVNLIMKAIVLVVGIIACILVLLVEQLGTVLELAYSTSGIANSALLGTFTLGMVFPWANWKGAVIGSAAGMLLVMVMMVGAQHAFTTGLMKYPRLPVSVEGCSANVTAAIASAAAATTPRPEATGSVPALFRVSYMYYTLLGTLVVMLVGAAASFATGATSPTSLDPALLAPQLRWLADKGRQRRQGGSRLSAGGGHEGRGGSGHDKEEEGATELLVCEKGAEARGQPEE